MHRRLWIRTMAGGALAFAGLASARAGEDPAQRLAISTEEVALVRAWLLAATTPVPRAMRASVSSTSAPDWLAAHPGPSDAAAHVGADPARLQRGERLPVPMYQLGEPLPPALLAQLPTQPRATMLLRFDRRLVRVFRPTRTVLDAVDL